MARTKEAPRWSVNDGQDGTTPRPWVWWGTGDKDASWQIGVAVDDDGKQLAGEFDEDENEIDAGSESEEAAFAVVIENICENPGSATGLMNAALIVEAVNAWSDPAALAARLECLKYRTPAELQGNSQTPTNSTSTQQGNDTSEPREPNIIARRLRTTAQHRRKDD